LSAEQRGRPLHTVLKNIQSTCNCRFFYKQEWINGLALGDSLDTKTLRNELDRILPIYGLDYVEIYPHSIVIVKDPTLLILRDQAINMAKREQRKVLSRKYGSQEARGPVARATGRRQINISGTINDSKNNEPLAGALIRLSDSTRSTTTNALGKFSIVLKPGDYIMTISYVNYDDVTIDLSAWDNGSMTIELDEAPKVLDEVVIQDRADREITTSRIGQVQVSIADIKRAPSILGEADLVKSVQSLAGVTTVGEAAAGFNVRGGSADQNLILYDGLPVINSSHAFGFLSSFNPQAVRDVSFYRAGIPAEFGGRVSSVLDIRSKEGSYEKWGGNAGIGIITGNVMVNGPIVKDKASILASVRSTYSNWLVHSIRSNYANLKQSKVSFYDGTIKLNHLIGQDTKLSLTGYLSQDGFRLLGDSSYHWSNKLLAARFDHQFSERLNMDVTAGISSYSYKVINHQAENAFELGYGLKTSSLKAAFNYRYGIHNVSFGTQLQHHYFRPGFIEPVGASSVNGYTMASQRSFENAVYAHDVLTFSDRMSVEGGLRIPMFSSNFGTSITYTGVEPRFGFRFAPDANSSIKAGYNRMYQFLHLISNTAAITPVDVWQPANSNFKPQFGDHISLGYFRNFKEKKYEASVEGFYKTTTNVLDFRNGAKLILNENLSEDLLTGKGKAYGVETMVGMVTGRFTGNINYTWSRSFRTVAGPTEALSINKGNQYPSNFDQPHVVNFSWKFSFTRRYHLTGLFTYHTGRPISVPLSGYIYERSFVANFSERNQYRIPDYHRLDLALVVEGNHKRKKLGDGTWVISFYNVYGRKNPYSVFYKTSNIQLLQPYQLSIVGTVMPSVSYNFSF
jgi:hypothetical protein